MLEQEIDEHITTMQAVLGLSDHIRQVSDVLIKKISIGGKILVCGNGGSAADAQHFAAEVVGRFKQERRAWPAIALTTDTSILTAVGNDFGFEEIFARQVEGVGKQEDVLLGISTSGNSLNVEYAVKMAKDMGMPTVGLLGKDGGKLATMVDTSIVVPSMDTARVQEAHIFILHHLAGQMESSLMEHR